MSPATGMPSSLPTASTGSVRLIEDRMRGLKMHIPKEGLWIKLIPTEDELEQCRLFVRHIAEVLAGRHREKSVIDFSDLVRQP